MTSPAKVLKVFKVFINLNAITADSKIAGSHPNKWFFSKEGEKAYHNARTLARKFDYFYDYLRSIEEVLDVDNKEKMLACIAFTMAHSMDSSSLEFAGYPNILDPEKNPVIKSLKEEGMPFLAVILPALLQVDRKELYSSMSSPYQFLVEDGEDPVTLDMYKIQRDLIFSYGKMEQYSSGHSLNENPYARYSTLDGDEAFLGLYKYEPNDEEEEER